MSARGPGVLAALEQVGCEVGPVRPDAACLHYACPDFDIACSLTSSQCELHTKSPMRDIASLEDGFIREYCWRSI